MLIEPPIRYFGKENVTSYSSLQSIVNDVYIFNIPFHSCNGSLFKYSNKKKIKYIIQNFDKELFASLSLLCSTRKQKCFYKEKSNVFV